MSALSTPGGGGTTAQSKPTSGKQKYQKLDINSLYCANKNENSEPSSVKAQLSRKHGMQSLGKVPSARRPPANLPSLKTETGQDPNANLVSTVTTTVSTPATCTSQATTTTSNSSAIAGGATGGWGALPPPSSSHFPNEFPSLAAAAQPSHRSAEHGPQPQLRPQTEGSWTCGGTAGVRPETTSSPVAAPASTPASQQTPAYRAILPSFLMKGSSSPGLVPGSLSTFRDNRSNNSSNLSGGSTANSNSGGQRQAPRPPATPRAVEVLTARPILREEQISSLDDISRDAGWAQHDDIDYDQKLDFSDGESTAPTSKSNSKNNNNRASVDNERIEPKIQEPGDEDLLWAERRQKQSNEVAQAVARARQRKEEEQRRQMRDTPTTQPGKDARDRDRLDRNERDRNDNRDKENDSREKERFDTKDRDRVENRDKERDGRDRDANFKDSRSDLRDREVRDKERVENRDKDRVENRERFENRERDRDRDRDRDSRDRGRTENRERQENDKDRGDVRDRDRTDNRDRMDRDRYERERERGERDRDRDRERIDRERLDRDRDFRDRDYNRDRDRDQTNPAFSKNFQANMPPRFLRQQQNRQQEEQHKGWAFSGKPAPRRQEPQSYNPPRHGQHNGRRSYSRDYSDREDDLRRDKDGSGPQWRSEMQDYERSGRELDRSNSKDSYKDYGDYKDRRNDNERKSMESSVENSSRSAADKLTEVFERKSIGVTEQLAPADAAVAAQAERIDTPPTTSHLESPEKDLSKTSWAEVTQEEQSKSISKTPEIVSTPKEVEIVKATPEPESCDTKSVPQAVLVQPLPQNTSSSNNNIANSYNQALQNQTLKLQQTNLQAPISQNFYPNSENNQTSSQGNSFTNNQNQHVLTVNQTQTISEPQIKPVNALGVKPLIQNDAPTNVPQVQKQSSDQIPQQNVGKPALPVLKPEKEVLESESIASKSSSDPSVGIKTNDVRPIDTTSANTDVQKRSVDDKRTDKVSNEQINKIPDKEPIERKSSGSGSEKKGRGYGGANCGTGGGGGNGGGYNVYRGWGTRESRGRRSHRSSRSNNRASESDGSTDGAANPQRKERRRAPRSPRGPKKLDRPEDLNNPPVDQAPPTVENMENREPFAPRGQPSRRGRGGFQGTSRPPAPAKRVTGYGPPNTKSPFSQANRAVKDSDENKDNLQEDKTKGGNKSRTGSSTGRGRDRRPKGAGGPHSGEDENWETTSEHSESGGAGIRRRSIGGRQSSQSQKSQGGRNQNMGNRQNNNRNPQGTKKDAVGDIKNNDNSEVMTDGKLATAKKEDEIIDDGFQEVRNKKNSKDARASSKEDSQNVSKQPRSRSNQGNGRNGSSSRNANDKSNTRGSAPVPGKPNSQYDRPRQANLAPRFVKQRQKQQMGLVFGPDTGAAPPPPAVNAWDKPISQSLRGNVDEPIEIIDNKSSQSSQRSTPGETPVENKTAPAACALVTDKSGVLDGTTPPVETIIFENTNYKTAPPAEALKQKYQPSANTAKPQGEEITSDMEARPLAFNGEVRSRPRSIQDIMSENGRPVSEADGSLGLQMPFDTSQKTEDSSDMKLDFAFDSDLGQLTEDKSAKTLGLPRGTHMSTSNTISPLAADLNLKIASVKKVWEMPAVAEGSEELQFAGFEETSNETGAPPNVCKVKPTQQLQSPPPQHYNHVGYQGGYGGLSVPSPPAVFNFNSSQQLLGSSQQLPQQGGLYGAFLDQSRGQFGGFPGTPYGAGSAAPYNYQPPPDMFQSLPSQYRMAAAAGGGAAFGQSGQLGNNPSTVLISSTSNSLMSATVKPSSQQIGAIGSKGGGVGGVGGVNTFQQQYMGYSGPVGDAPYSLPGLLPRPAPPASSYYSPYQPPAAPAPTYPLQFTQPAQSSAFSSQFLSSQLHVAAAVQQMQQQYRAPPLQQQYAPPQPRPPPQQQLKSPLHEHANGFAPLCDASSPTPKGASKPQKPHSPPHKYHAPPPHAPHGPHAPHPSHPQHPPPAHTPHQHHQHQQQVIFEQMLPGGNNGRCGGGASGVNGGNALTRGGMAPRYPAPIQRPHAPALPLYRAPAPAPRPPHARPNLYYHHHQRNGSGGAERTPESGEQAAEEAGETPAVPDAPPAADVKAD